MPEYKIWYKDTSKMRIYVYGEKNQDTAFQLQVWERNLPDGHYYVYYDTSFTHLYHECFIKRPSHKLAYDSISRYWYRNGNLQHESFSKNNMDEGVSKSFYPSGRLEFLRRYCNDSVVGVDSTFFESGVIKNLKYYANGRGVRELQYNEKANLIKEIIYSPDMASGHLNYYEYLEINYSPRGELLNIKKSYCETEEKRDSTEIISTTYLRRIDLDSLSLLDSINKVNQTKNPLKSYSPIRKRLP